MIVDIDGVKYQQSTDASGDVIFEIDQAFRSELVTYLILYRGEAGDVLTAASGRLHEIPEFRPVG